MHPSRVRRALALGCTARSASQGVCKGIAGHGCVIIYYGAPAASTAKILELHTGVGISVGIGWYFVGIIPTNTNGKLGW
jgi:hypothetical protein